jgi:hypothetical protein
MRADAAVSIRSSTDPAMHFILRHDLTDYQRPDNLTAEHAKVRECLGLAMQAIGSSLKRKGELVIPRLDPHSGVNSAFKIGSWEFTRDPDGER